MGTCVVGIIEIVVGSILGLWLLTAVQIAVIRIGIREYFKQKRIYFLEMLKYGVPPEEQKENYGKLER